MFDPGWKESMFASARSIVSCTKSSARSTLPLSEMAKARKLGPVARLSSRCALVRGMVSPLLLFVVWRRGGRPALALRVKLADQFRKAVGHPLPDHIVIDGPKLMPDPGLN